MSRGIVGKDTIVCKTRLWLPSVVLTLRRMDNYLRRISVIVRHIEIYVIYYIQN